MVSFCQQQSTSCCCFVTTRSVVLLEQSGVRRPDDHQYSNNRWLCTEQQTTTVASRKRSLVPIIKSIKQHQSYPLKYVNSKHTTTVLFSDLFHNSNNNNLIAAVDPTTIIPTTATTTTTFEPVLNVPAFSVFVFIAIIFLGLQIRIRMIEQAVEQRTAALRILRTVKAQELSGGGGGAGIIITATDVEQAVTNYRTAYEKVESLREVIPGVRIIQPPSRTVSRTISDENSAAAQQFLGILPESSNQQQQLDENNNKGLSILQTTALVFIFVSQCTLLLFLLFDPIVFSGDLNNINQLVDTISNLE